MYYYNVTILQYQKGICFIGLKSDIKLDKNAIEQKVKNLRYYTEGKYEIRSFYEMSEKDFKDIHSTVYHCG